MNTEMVLLVITCSTGRRILPEEVQTRVQTKPGPLLKTSRTLTWVFTSWPHNQFHSSSVTHTTLHLVFSCYRIFHFYLGKGEVEEKYAWNISQVPCLSHMLLTYFILLSQPPSQEDGIIPFYRQGN